MFFSKLNQFFSRTWSRFLCNVTTSNRITKLLKSKHAENNCVNNQIKKKKTPNKSNFVYFHPLWYIWPYLKIKYIIHIHGHLKKKKPLYFISKMYFVDIFLLWFSSSRFFFLKSKKTIKKLFGHFGKKLFVVSWKKNWQKIL